MSAKRLNSSKGGISNGGFRTYLLFFLVDIADFYDDSVFFHDAGAMGINDVRMWSSRN